MKRRIEAGALVLLTVIVCACTRRENADVTQPAAEPAASLQATAEAMATAMPQTESVTEPSSEAVTEPATEPETVTDEPHETTSLTHRDGMIESLLSTVFPTKAKETTTEPVTKSMRVSGYGKQAVIDYFVLTAMNAERGTSPHRVIKWVKPIKVYLAGHCSDTDKALVQSLCNTLNQIDGFPGISVTDSVTDIDIYMVFEGSVKLSQLIENYELFDDGYCGVVWNGSYEITNAVIGINSGMVNVNKRRSVICEELLQAMGLLNDSYEYKESIFYQASDSVTWPANLDWGLVTVLYNPGMKPGLKESEARAVAESFVKSGY